MSLWQPCWGLFSLYWEDVFLVWIPWSGHSCAGMLVGLCPPGLPFWIQAFAGSSILPARAAAGQCYELLCLFTRAQLPEGATNVPKVQFQSPSDRVVIHPGTLDRSTAGHQLHRGHQKLWPRSKIYLGVGNQLFNTWPKECLFLQPLVVHPSS